MTHHLRTSCRVCGQDRLQSFLSLGPSPLANSFRASADSSDEEQFFPLDVYFCDECGLVQLLDVIDPQTLFAEYIYVTGTSETIAAHNRKYAQTVTDLLSLDQDDLVVEIASNDGSLLKCFRELGVKVLGVEPAANIASMAISNGIDTVNTLFNHNCAVELRSKHGPAKAIIANNVLAHVDEVVDFLQGCEHLIDEDGQIVIEVPSLRELIEGLEYDTIYHEHLCYFSVSALKRLFEECGLSIVRVDHVSVHGGSLRIYARRQSAAGSHAAQVLELVERETQDGLNSMARYRQFEQDVLRHREQLLTFLEKIKDDGKTIAGYGAPAKGNTLLNFCKIDTRLLQYTVDKNPLKVGKFTPGTHIPVLPTETILEKQPDYVLILAWNFAEEIIKQQAEYRNRGGQFIVPFPEPRIF